MDDEQIIDTLIKAMNVFCGVDGWQLRDFDGSGDDIWCKVEIYTPGLRRLPGVLEDLGIY